MSDNAAYVLNLSTCKLMELGKYDCNYLGPVSLSQDLAVLSFTRYAKLIDLKSGKLINKINISGADGYYSGFEHISISPDNRFVTIIHRWNGAKIIDLNPPIPANLNSAQIELINWMYRNKIDNHHDYFERFPIILNSQQTAIFLTFDENMQNLVLHNYDLQMEGLKPTFANAIRYQMSLDAIQHNNCSTQSKQHIVRLGINYIIQNILQDPKNKEFFLKIYAQEKVEHSNGDYVFFHGREWRWNFLSDIYKQLWNITKNDFVKNYEFLRFGVSGKRRNGRDILFMNSAIFGNSTNEGSCTAYYWHTNMDQSSIAGKVIYVSQIFETFKLEEIYKKYSANLKELEELHKKCSNRGEILLVSVPKSMLKHVICTQMGGGTKPIDVRGRYAFITGAKKTSDPQTILDAVKDPKQTIQRFDRLEWGLVLGNFDNQGNYTVNPVTNNPNQGISIYSFHDADEKKMHEYEKMRDEIFAKIKADLKGKQAPLLRSKL